MWDFPECPRCGSGVYRSRSESETIVVCVECGWERVRPDDPIPGYAPPAPSDLDPLLESRARRESIGSLYACGTVASTAAVVVGASVNTVWRALDAIEGEGSGIWGELPGRIRARRRQAR